MRPIEQNPRFTNPLINSSSPYLRQHAHNPVFWYPWSKEVLEQARVTNKPIFLSIGYSTCYWCHVMEREVFQNLSIASLMNRSFLNIKVDREEHPHLDEFYMVARQLMTHEGGWPNNIFLTPDLKPFYAGGTFGPDESYGKPAFPRLLEWINYAWTTQQDEIQTTAHDMVKVMQPFLVFTPRKDDNPSTDAQQIYEKLLQHYDARSGGFFQAPKFPHECYLSFLIAYYEHTQTRSALDMVSHTLGKMATGGIYDQVGCGFHRYAVDKEWYVPHFEKMLYTQAQMARLYTDAARITGNEYFADIAKGTLEFVSAPMSDGNGVFYSGIDAETDGVEGGYYAWSSQELESLLSEEEIRFFTNLYALADIPQFPGHKHTDGQVIIARKPLNIVAQELNSPYVQIAAITGQLMNKLLAIRNNRTPPSLDNKVIIAWNGLMIDAFAHAGAVFSDPSYTKRARNAASFLLENAIDNEGKLRRMYMGGKAQLEATLEDYAFFIKGLLTLWKVEQREQWLDSAQSLMQRADELFADNQGVGYFHSEQSSYLPIRAKNSDDGAMPSANAIMIHNLIDLFEATKNPEFKTRAEKMTAFFLHHNPHNMIEFSTVGHASLRLDALNGIRKAAATPPATFEADTAPLDANQVVTVTTSLYPENAKPDGICEVTLSLDIKEGWYIQANQVNHPDLVPTQVEVQGEGVETLGIFSAEAKKKNLAGQEAPILIFEGHVDITARIKLPSNVEKRPPIKVMLRFQPCFGVTCHAVQDIVVTI